jgi:hypothetical protein
MFKSSSDKAVVFKSIIFGIGIAMTAYGASLAYAAAAAQIAATKQWLLNIAMDANPIGAVVAILGALATAFAIAWQKSDTFRAAMKGLFEVIIIGAKTAFEIFKEWLTVLWHIITLDWCKLAGDLTKMKDTFMKAGKDAGEAFKGAFDKEMLKATTDAFNVDFNKKVEELNKKKAEGKISEKDLKSELKNLQTEAGNANLHGKLSNTGLHEDMQKLRDLYYGKREVKGGDTTGGMKQSAINTSALSGASGGLGQAKTINVHIDTVQKIVGVASKDLKEKGKDAAEMILRTVNNISYSQGGTM